MQIISRIVALAVFVFGLGLGASFAQTNCPTEAQLTAAEAKGEALVKQLESQYQPKLASTETTLRKWIALGCVTTPSNAGCPTKGQALKVIADAQALEKQYSNKYASQIQEILALDQEGCVDLSVELQMLMNELSYLETTFSSMIRGIVDLATTFERSIKQ